MARPPINKEAHDRIEDGGGRREGARRRVCVCVCEHTHDAMRREVRVRGTAGAPVESGMGERGEKGAESKIGRVKLGRGEG